MKTIKEITQSKSEKKEIYWNVINALLGGAISFFSILLATGEITVKGIGISLLTLFLVAVTRFKEYWTKEEKEYKHKQIKSFQVRFL